MICSKSDNPIFSSCLILVNSLKVIGLGWKNSVIIGVWTLVSVVVLLICMNYSQENIKPKLLKLIIPQEIRYVILEQILGVSLMNALCNAASIKDLINVTRQYQCTRKFCIGLSDLRTTLSLT